MPFHSILGESSYYLQPSEVRIPDFFKDLNLEAVISEILVYSKDYPIRRYFYDLALCEEMVYYRQEVFFDMNNPLLRAALADFSQKMKRSREFLSYMESETVSELKRGHFCFDAARLYTEAAGDLLSVLSQNFVSDGKKLFSSKGITDFYHFLEQYCRSDVFVAIQKEVDGLKEALNGLCFRMELSGTKITLHEDYDLFDAREEMMRRCGFVEDSKKERCMKSPFQNILELEEFEELLLSMMKKGHSGVFKSLLHFAEHNRDFYETALFRFEEEIQVYLAVWEFMDSMKQKGFAFAKPETLLMGVDSKTEGSCFLLQDLYDLALACKHRISPKKMIPNDCSYDRGEKFFVITGPNQGGKTTFARAVGQAVYFHQMGFYVPAREASLPVFSALYTHFSADEDVKNGVGKLKEELERLSPMLKSSVQNGFVILNELFTTATTYDAEIMGKDVLHQFMKKGFYGIYVTHIQALAKKQDGIVSLAAMVDEIDQKTRTYRIVRKPAQGLAYAQTIAAKYRLSTEDILKRIPAKI